MPIVAFKDALLIQRCSACQAERELARDELLTEEAAAALESGVLALPPCSCGSREFLVQSSEGDPKHSSPGSFGHRHRLLVDGLVDALRERDSGEIASLETAVAAAIGEHAEEQWFSEGLRIELTSLTDEPPEPEHHETSRSSAGKTRDEASKFDLGGSLESDTGKGAV